MNKRSNRSNKGKQTRGDPKEREMEVEPERDQVDTPKAHVSVNTRRQRNLEISREIERDLRHQARSRKSVPGIRNRTRPDSLEAEDRTYDRYDNSLALLNSTTLSESTLSATPYPGAGENTTARSWAILPGDHDRPFMSYLDHGSWACLLSQKLVDRFQLHVHRADKPISLKGISRYSETSSELTKLTFRFDGRPRVFKVWFWILSKECMDNDIVLGRKFLKGRLGFKTNRAWDTVTGARREKTSSLSEPRIAGLPVQAAVTDVPPPLADSIRGH